MKTPKPTYEKNWRWGALGCYPLGMSPSDIEATETALRALVTAIAEKRGLIGKKGKASRQSIARRLRSHGLNSSYAAAIREEIAK